MPILPFDNRSNSTPGKWLLGKFTFSTFFIGACQINRKEQKMPSITGTLFFGGTAAITIGIIAILFGLHQANKHKPAMKYILGGVLLIFAGILLEFGVFLWVKMLFP